MKKILQKVFYRSPEITIATGAVVLYLAASSSDYGTMYGNGSPAWTGWAALAGFLTIGVGGLLARIRGAVKEANKRNDWR